MGKKRTMLQRAMDNSTGGFTNDIVNLPINTSSSPDGTLDISTELAEIDFGPTGSLFGDLFPEEEIKKEEEKQERPKSAFELHQRNFLQEEFDKERERREFAEETERLLHEPMNVVEGQLQSALPSDEYRNYKKDKIELSKLEEKTLGKSFMGGMKDFYEGSNLELDNFFDSIGLKEVPEAVKEPLLSVSSVLGLLPNLFGSPLGQLSPKKHFSNQEKERYEELKDKIHAYEKPVLEEQKKLIQEELDALTEKFQDIEDRYSSTIKGDLTTSDLDKKTPEEASKLLFDKEKLDLIKKNYEDILESYDEAINRTGYWGIFTKDPKRSLTLGYSEIRESLALKEAKDKANEKGGENLTEIEQEFLKSRLLLDEVRSQKLNDNILAEVGETVRESLILMAETALVDRVTGGAGRALKLGTIKGLRGLGLSGLGLKTALSEATVLGGVLGVAGKSTIAPNTYNQYVDKSLSSGEVINRGQDNEEVVFSDARKNVLVKEAKAGIAELEAELLEIRNRSKVEELTEEDNTRLSEIYSQLDNGRNIIKELVNEKGEINKPEFNDLKAAVNAIQSKSYERVAETYGGALADKAFSKIGNRLSNSKLANTWGGKKLSNLNQTYKNATDGFNRLLMGAGSTGRLTKAFTGHVGAPKILHSLPSEVVEEVMVQVMPVLGEDYIEQTAELLDPDFYKMVLASTLIMGGKGAVVGGATNAFRYRTDKEYRNQVDYYEELNQNQKKLYKDLDKNGITDEGLAKRVAMGTLGTIYQYNDYVEEIAKLKKEALIGTPEEKAEKELQAKQLEDTSFYNMAVQAVNTGTTAELRNTLRRLANRNRKDNTLSDESVTAVQRGLNTLNRLEELSERYSNRLNYEEIARASLLKDMAEFANSQLEEKKNIIRPQAEAEMEAYNETNGRDEGYTLDDFSLESLSNLAEDNSALLNSYVADVMKDNSNFKDFIELQLQQETLQTSIDKYNSDIKYELDPKNETEIRRREFLKQKESVLNKIENDETYLEVIESTKNLEKEAFYQDFLDEASGRLRKAKLQASVKAALKKHYEKGGQLSSPGTSNPEAPSVEALPEEVPLGVVIPKESIPSQESTEGFVELLDEEDLFIKGEKRPFEGGETLSFEDEFGSPQELSPDEAALLNQSQQLFEPIEIEEDNNSHSEKIAGLESIIDKLVKSQPSVTFNGLVSSLFNNPNIGAVRVNKMFNFIAQAWNNTSPEKLSKEDTLALYETLFPSADIVDAIANVFNSANSVASKPVKLDNKAINTEVNPVQEYNEESKKLEEVNFAPHTERLWADVGLKLGGVLGINYIETPEGREDTTDLVNEDAKPFMDWRNFREGSDLELVINTDYLLDPDAVISEWDNLDGLNITPEDRPFAVKVSLRDKLIDIFKNDPSLDSWDKIKDAIEYYSVYKNPDNPLFKNEEFLKIMPIGTLNKNYTSDQTYTGVESPSILPGGLNDYNWINNRNVALRITKQGEPLLAEREKRIRANKEINLKARKLIAANGSLQVSIKEKRDAKNNTRELITSEDKARGYTEDFHDVLTQVGNSLLQFHKQSAVGHMDKNILSSYEDNAGNRLPIHINGKEVKIDQIKNYREFYQKALESGMTSGRTVFITQDGVRADGTPEYVIHNIVSNHSSKQEQFKREHEIIQKLYYQIISDTTNDYPREAKELFKRNFKTQFGYDFNQAVKDRLDKLSPTPLNNGTYRQDYNSRALTPAKDPNLNMVPDLSGYSNVSEFIQDVLNNAPIPKINKLEKVLRNLHTNLVFTPIDKNGDVIYVNHSQPIINFNFDYSESLESAKKEKQRIEEYEKLLNKRKEFLEKESSPEAKEELQEVEKEIIETKKEARKVEEALNSKEVFPILEQETFKTLSESLGLEINETNEELMVNYLENFVDLNIMDILNKLEAAKIIEKDC